MAYRGEIKMPPAISVIMSAYNTEAYIEKTIQSILAQTFSDFEFLIVDNGSNDKTGRIIDRYAGQDARIAVIHNAENVAPSEALNCALDRAKGIFLYVLDSDDWVLPNLLEKLHERAVKHGSQCVYCGFCMDYLVGDKTYSFSVCPADADYTQLEFRRSAIDDITRMILTVYWNKLTSLEYIREKGIRFRNTKMFDHHFNMDILMDIERVSSVGNPLYHYIRARKGSYMGSNPDLNRKKREHFAHTMKLYQHWKVSDQQTLGRLAEYHLNNLLRCVMETGAGKSTWKQKKEELKKMKEDEWTAFAIRNCPKGLKLMAFKFLLASGSALPCWIFGKTATGLQRLMPGFYYGLRANIAQRASRIEG